MRSLTMLTVVLLGSTLACVPGAPDTHCYSDEECPTGYRCDLASKTCMRNGIVGDSGSDVMVLDASAMDSMSQDTNSRDIGIVDSDRPDADRPDLSFVDGRHPDTVQNDRGFDSGVLDIATIFDARRADTIQALDVDSVDTTFLFDSGSADVRLDSSPGPTVSVVNEPQYTTILANPPVAALRFRLQSYGLPVPMSCLRFAYSFVGVGFVSGATLWWGSDPVVASSYSGGAVVFGFSPSRVVDPAASVECLLHLDVEGFDHGTSLAVSLSWDDSCAVGALVGPGTAANTLTAP